MVSTHQLARAIFPLTIDGAITLGRADNNAIVIPESAASRLHAEIMGARGSWTVRDQSSANGTWVNGERVREAVLQNGDYLRVGTVDFRFFLGPPRQQRTTAPRRPRRSRRWPSWPLRRRSRAPRVRRC